MKILPVFEAYLSNATGLSRERVAYLYRAGHPWPLFTTQDERRAMIYAQAYSIPFVEALALADQVSDMEHMDLTLVRADAVKVKDRTEALQKAAALAAVPCLKEVLDHSQRVVALTQEKPGTIFRLCHAIQQFAEEHPGWIQEESVKGCRSPINEHCGRS